MNNDKTKKILEDALSPLPGVKVMTFKEFQDSQVPQTYDGDDDGTEECDLCNNLALKGKELCEDCEIKVNKEAEDEEKEHMWEIDRQIGRK